MNMKPEYPSQPRLLELRRLISGLCDSELQPNEAARLEELVSTDEACCEYYVTAMHVNAALPRYVGADRRSISARVAEREILESTPSADALPAGPSHSPGITFPEATEETGWGGNPWQSLFLFCSTIVSAAWATMRSLVYGGLQVFGVMDREAPGPIDCSHSAVRRTPLFSRLRRGLKRGREFLSRPTPVALSWASFLLLCILIAFGMWPLLERQHPPGLALATHAHTFVARLTALSEVQWLDANMSPMGLSLLAEGQELELISGLAEVTFHDGAKVLLEGPSKFTVQSRHEGALRHGRLTAKMPPHALGLVIHTPVLEVVGLGTEFGMEVEPDRSADLEIFSGAVEFWPAWQANESTIRHRLTARRAVHVEGVSGGITWVEPQQDHRYTRQMPLRSIEHTVLGGPLVPGHFSTDREQNVLVVYTNAPVPSSGYIDSFVFYKQQATGAGRVFQAYVLRPTGKRYEYKVLFDSGSIDTTSFAGGEMQTIPIGPVTVEPGDLIAHHGSGIPQVLSVPGGVPFAYPVGPPPAAPATFTSKPFHKHNGQDFELRSYSFGATFTPSQEP